MNNQTDFFEALGVEGDFETHPETSKVESVHSAGLTLPEAFARMHELSDSPEGDLYRQRMSELIEEESLELFSDFNSDVFPPKGDEKMVLLNMRLDDDFTEDDEDWGRRIP